MRAFKKTPLFGNRIFVILHDLMRDHWLCAVIYEPKDKAPEICLFDSLQPGDETKASATLTQKQVQGLQELCQLKFGKVGTLCTYYAALPQQTNNYDCGLYVLEYLTMV
jgi:Ulp1 family protease